MFGENQLQYTDGIKETCLDRWCPLPRLPLPIHPTLTPGQWLTTQGFGPLSKIHFEPFLRGNIKKNIADYQHVCSNGKNTVQMFNPCTVCWSTKKVLQYKRQGGCTCSSHAVTQTPQVVGTTSSTCHKQKVAKRFRKHIILGVPVDVDTFFFGFSMFFFGFRFQIFAFDQNLPNCASNWWNWPNMVDLCRKNTKKTKKKIRRKSTYKSVFRRINWFSDEILRNSTRLLDGFFLKKIICHPNIQKPKIGLTKSWFPIVQVAQTTTNAKTHPLV